MSWSIKSVGPRAAVRAAVLAVAHMPVGLQAAIVCVLDETGNAGYVNGKSVPHDSARVEGFGHSGGGYGSIGKLEVELFTAAALTEPTDRAIFPANQGHPEAIKVDDRSSVAGFGFAADVTDKCVGPS